MSCKFMPGAMYRMPTHFGPSLGPRQGPARRRFRQPRAPKVTAYAVRFLPRRDQLEALLPDGFTVGAEPVMTVEAPCLTEIEWLAVRERALTEDCVLLLIEAGDRTTERMGPSTLSTSDGSVSPAFAAGTRAVTAWFHTAGDVGGSFRIEEGGAVIVECALARGLMPQAGLALMR